MLRNPIDTPPLNVAIQEADYVKLPDITEEGFDRYEVKFKDGKVPLELLYRADDTDVGKNENTHFATYPDENVLVHLKDYGNSMEMGVNLIGIEGGVTLTSDVKLNETERVIAADMLTNLAVSKENAEKGLPVVTRDDVHKFLKENGYGNKTVFFDNKIAHLVNAKVNKEGNLDVNKEMKGCADALFAEKDNIERD